MYKSVTLTATKQYHSDDVSYLRKPVASANITKSISFTSDFTQNKILTDGARTERRKPVYQGNSKIFLLLHRSVTNMFYGVPAYNQTCKTILTEIQLLFVLQRYNNLGTIGRFMYWFQFIHNLWTLAGA